MMSTMVFNTVSLAAFLDVNERGRDARSLVNMGTKALEHFERRRTSHARVEQNGSAEELQVLFTRSD